MNGLYGWKPPTTIGAKRYLEQRDAETIAAERAVLTDRYKRSVTWLEKYHTRGRKTAINWSPSITVTTTEETTSEEIHHQEGQAAEVGIAEGVGDAPSEQRDSLSQSKGARLSGRGNPVRQPGESSEESPQGDSEHPGGAGGDEPDAVAGSRFARAEHTDFGDGDTPF